MLPIIIAPTPINQDGTVKNVAIYQEWRNDLIMAYGGNNGMPYCAYCNMKISYNINVDHIEAQIDPNVDPLEFTNLLLCCQPCNIKKSNNPINRVNFFMPFWNNTNMYFDFIFTNNPLNANKPICIISPASNLDRVKTTKARNTVELFGLDNVELTNRVTDLRSIERANVYNDAELTRKNWDRACENNCEHYLINLFNGKFETGFFSIWYKFFHDVPEVISILMQFYRGINKACFDQNTFSNIEL